MFRRSVTLRGVVFTSVIGLAVAGTSASWQKTDPSQWTSDDVYQILNNSPWSKSVGVSVARGAGYGGTSPGTNGTWGEGGPSGGAGGMGRGGIGTGGPGGGGMGRGRGSGYPSPESTTSAVVQWQSALPVRLAEAKHGGSAVDLPMKPLNEYVIAVIGLPKSGFRSDPAAAGGNSDDDSDDSRLADHLRVITVLSVRHQRLNPVKVELNQGRDGRAIFHFEKSEPITLSDKDIEFRITSDRMELRKKFALKDMEYQGKLEL